MAIPTIILTAHLTIATVTGYTSTGRRCADLSWPKVGDCAAPRSVPLHSMVLIDGKPYLVTDRLNRKWNDERWDIYFNTSQEALNFGKQKLTIIYKTN